MSTEEAIHRDEPRVEPWLVVMFASMIPVIVMQFLPGQFLYPLIALGIALLLAALVMLARQVSR